MLVVDDNETAREVISCLLKSMTFLVSTVSSGNDAVREIERAAEDGTPYEMVLLDWQMPELDGIATARLIRSLPLQTMPILVMVTAYGRDDLLIAANQVGIVDVIPKPVTASTLFDTLMKLLGNVGENAGIVSGKVKTSLISQSTTPAITGAHILLVEDNELNREVAIDLLNDFKFTVDAAENGAVALKLLAENEYDLVLMDMQMPVMDGITATKEIRRQPRFNSLPILAMTANAMSSDRDVCLAAGMNDHLGKPIDPDLLYKSLCRWIKPKNGRPENQASGIPDEGSAKAPPSNQLLSPAQSQEMAALSKIDGLDVELGLQLVRGREALYQSLLKKFVAGHGNFPVQIETTLMARDWDTALRLAHTFKGLCAQIGAEPLREKALRLELALKLHETADTLKTLTGQMSEMLNPFLAAIKHALPDTQGHSAPTAISEPLFEEICTRLISQFECSDFAAIDEFKKNESVLRRLLGEDFEDIQTDLENFNFETALSKFKLALGKTH
jgi:two-component system sensor histidine kinase/response regulator